MLLYKKPTDNQVKEPIKGVYHIIPKLQHAHFQIHTLVNLMSVFEKLLKYSLGNFFFLLEKLIRDTYKMPHLLSCDYKKASLITAWPLPYHEAASLLHTMI